MRQSKKKPVWRRVWEEFEHFAIQGNVIDMAVGIIIGTAFNAIVNSLVNDILMPPIGVLVGGIDFSKLQIVLKRAQDGSVKAAIGYGKFINVSVEFIVVSFAMFILVKGINRLKADKETKASQEPSEEVLLLREIRDLLKNKKSINVKNSFYLRKY